MLWLNPTRHSWPPNPTVPAMSGQPFADFYVHHGEGSYFETELVECEWTGFGVPVCMPSYRRPMSAVINPPMGAGFVLEQLLEPVPTEEFRPQAPEEYQELTKRPGFLCVRARKGRSGGIVESVGGL